MPDRHQQDPIADREFEKDAPHVMARGKKFELDRGAIPPRELISKFDGDNLCRYAKRIKERIKQSNYRLEQGHACSKASLANSTKFSCILSGLAWI